MPISSLDLATMLDKVKKNQSEGSGVGPGSRSVEAPTYRVGSSRDKEAAAPAKVSAPAPAAQAPAGAEGNEELALAAPSTDLAMPDEGISDLEMLREVLREDEQLIEKLLGLLYLVKKLNPHSAAAVSIIEIEKRLNLPREGGTFIFGYMKTKRLIEADDKSRFAITVKGIDYLREVVISRVTKGE